jgi:Cys-tRNA(Pro)/Cys-tRNA(Cys) deacylase
MSKSTRATVALDKVGINFTLHSYDYDPDAERVGLQAAEALGIEPRRPEGRSGPKPRWV